MQVFISLVSFIHVRVFCLLACLFSVYEASTSGQDRAKRVTSPQKERDLAGWELDPLDPMLSPLAKGGVGCFVSTGGSSRAGNG